MEYPRKFSKKWLAVYTLPRLEQTVRTKIEKMGVESFLPTKMVTKQWSDRKKKVEEPLFPNYVFVKTSLQERFELFNVKGLVRFITSEGQPVEIPENDIEDIKNLVLTDNTSISCHSYAGNIGDKVLIEHGQFAGITGIVTKLNGKDRLVIKIKALRQMVSVNISAENISIPQK